jgi:hypothetical protein
MNEKAKFDFCYYNLLNTHNKTLVCGDTDNGEDNSLANNVQEGCWSKRPTTAEKQKIMFDKKATT